MNQTAGVNKHHAGLARLEGVYRGIESVSSGKETIGVYRNRVVLAGFFAELNYSQEKENEEIYSMHAMIGWSIIHERYFMNWFDSIGGTGAGILGIIQNDKIVLQGPDSAQGGFTRFTWMFAPSSHTVSIDSSIDGKKWQQALQTRYELLEQQA